MELLYSYDVCRELIEQQGKILYGRRFRIHPPDLPAVERMIAYFLQDEERARAEKIYLGKGLMVSGPVGCGKTALMHVFAAMSGGVYTPRLVNARQIALEFSKQGHDVIRKYSDLAFDPVTQRPVAYCFDGLGAESDMQYYGQPCNVMAEILLSRSELARPHRMLTHITTNLGAMSLEKRYGKQVRSRMRAMFNVIDFSPDSPDKNA